MKAVLTTRSPRLRSLLELQQHISAVFIVVEMLDVVEDEDKRSAHLACASQGNLFELVQSCRDLGSSLYAGRNG